MPFAFQVSINCIVVKLHQFQISVAAASLMLLFVAFWLYIRMLQKQSSWYLSKSSLAELFRKVLPSRLEIYQESILFNVSFYYQ